MERVTFRSRGETLVGHFYAAGGAGDPAPAVVILGPMTFQKEQAPTEYAKRFPALGFSALAFDPRFRGESSGEPRCWENPMAKVEDLISAVDYLASRADVDRTRIAMLGICQGSSEVLRAAADDPRVKALATIAGQYRDREGDVAWLTEEGLAARLEAGRAARAKFSATGEVDYVKGVDQHDMNVGMPGEFVWVWYQPWADRGIWENRYAVMSDADLLEYESASAAQRLDTPYLMIHSDHCFLPEAARRQFGQVRTVDKRLDWDGETPHLSYYDQPAVIDSAIGRVAAWYREHIPMRSAKAAE
jgi:fermentation-respiration switch protein FrsA (DUF1100 family)